jgi:hydrophobic/amphiphilic exporter-1 (mainly G- bacteria), HAE1 family
MTSLAFILGVLPLVFATGAGQVARRSVGTTVAGGMILSTVLNLLFIPILYVVIQTIRAWFGASTTRHQTDEATQPST